MKFARLFPVLIIVALAAASPSVVTAAAAEPAPVVGEISIFVHPPNNPGGHALELHVFPQQGVAVVKTRMSEERGINYAVSIPKRRFEGSLDLNFPHLGKIAGNVRAAPGQTACGEVGGDGPTFRGRLRFRGIGGQGRWSAKNAEAELRDACQPIEPPRGEGEALLRNVVYREGPGFFGPNSIAFFARSFTRRRDLEFVAVAGDAQGSATFLATDVEFLPGRVAAERWISRAGVKADRTLSVNGEPRMPTSATFKPPSPFFGDGIYDPRTRTLTGALGVRFPGLTVRLAHPPMDASLTDEERR
jgi:hypothetical protein